MPMYVSSDCPATQAENSDVVLKRLAVGLTTCHSRASARRLQSEPPPTLQRARRVQCRVRRRSTSTTLSDTDHGKQIRLHLAERLGVTVFPVAKRLPEPEDTRATQGPKDHSKGIELPPATEVV